MTNDIQNDITAMEKFLQQKLNGHWSILAAFDNLNSHFIDSGNRNQTKRNSQPKLYYKGKLHNFSLIHLPIPLIHLHFYLS